MEKSVFTREYLTFLRTLRRVREDAGLTQGQLADLLQETQSWVSKCERGQRRLDVVELQAFLRILGISLEEFARKLKEEEDDSKGRP